MSIKSVSCNSVAKPVAAVHMSDIKALAKDLKVARQSLKAMVVRLKGASSPFNIASKSEITYVNNLTSSLYDRIDTLRSSIKNSEYAHSPKKLIMLDKIENKYTKAETGTMSDFKKSIENFNSSVEATKVAGKRAEDKVKSTEVKKDFIKENGYDADFNGGFVH